MTPPSTRLEPIDAEEMRRAASGVNGLPVEQSAAWESFEDSQGRSLWGRFAFFEADKVCAVIALYEYRIRRWKYLWAKNGPVWIKEPTPAREQAFRDALGEFIRSTDPSVAFVRMHAWYRAPDLRDLLQTVTYDRTVVIDTSGGTEESILKTMPTDGRRVVRRGLKKFEEAGLRFVEDTGLDADRFRAHYEVMEQTSSRDGFRPHPAATYLQMLESLGPEHARLFSIRDADDRVLCWDIVLVNDRRAQAEYGASTDEARRLSAPGFLDHRISVVLAGEGVKGFDLMGAHSARVPELFTVGKYKKNFASHYTDVAGGWDFVIKPRTYGLIKRLLGLKRRLARPS